MKHLSLISAVGLASIVSAQNVVQNGDFSNGNSGFLTDYLHANNLSPEGKFAVTVNPRNNHM